MKQIYCFSHIPKAAGTTFIHLLRSNFGIRHVDAIHRMPKGATVRTYRRRDFRIDRRLIPWARSFAGHWLRPADLWEEADVKLHWFVILREPKARSFSQYHQDLELGRLPSDTSFADWAKMEHFGLRNRNAQCRQICGSEDAVLALKTIAERRIMTGLLEEFDLSLKAWRSTVGLHGFDLRYQQTRNVRTSMARITERLAEQKGLEADLADHNEQDEILYDSVKSDLFPRWLERLGGRERLSGLEIGPGSGRGASPLKVLSNRLFRNLCYKPWVALDKRLPRKTAE